MIRDGSLSLLLLSVVALNSGCKNESSSATSERWQQRTAPNGAGQALVLFDDGMLVSATGEGLWSSSDRGDSWYPLSASGLPRGRIVTMTAVGSSGLAAYVWGRGLFGSDDRGATWRELGELFLHPLVPAVTGTRAAMVPFVIGVDPVDSGHMVAAGTGGYLVTEDGGLSWRSLDINGPSGGLNLLFTGAAVRGDSLYATSQLPAGILPPLFSAILDGGVLVSEDRGESWQPLGDPFPTPAPFGIVVGSDERIYVGTQDDGLYRLSALGAWESLGGPSDIVAISAYDGGVAVGSGSRGPWRWDFEEQTWSRAWAVSDASTGSPNAAESAVAALAADHALLENGAFFTIDRDSALPEGPTEPAGGTVYLALSMHTNLYHSYRGDTNDDDGYGTDIRVIRNTLDWLDALPDVHADWDIDNYFSIDGDARYGYGWLKTDAPDILQRIRERREAGRDGIRVMSWNNGAVSWQTFEEFEQSVQRAKSSYLDVFGGFDPGVQPQENMFCPDHVGWYRQLGIQWITLFYSMTPFTGFPLDHELQGAEVYNPVTLRDGEDSMVLVPVYQHGDVVDRGSLAGWARQLHNQFPGDTLLVIHFDADAESWLNFDQEVDGAAELDFVRFTTIQAYLDAHEPVGELQLEGDLADGVGDGFQSWAEKQINQEVATQVARARELTDWARVLAPEDDGVELLVQEALIPRLLTMSTTNFGLASPYLHPQRRADALAFAADSVGSAQAAFDAATAVAGEPEDGTVQLVNARDSAGIALVEIPLAVPADVYEGPQALAVEQAGTELAAEVVEVDDTTDPVSLRATVVLPFVAKERKTLSWRYDSANPRTTSGSVSDLAAIPLEAPFTECEGARAEAALIGTQGAVDEFNVHRSERRQYELGFCDGVGAVEIELSRYDGHPGTVVAVTADMGIASQPTLAESVALSPLRCQGDVDTIRWRTMGGVERIRPARPGQQTWNAQSPDGWVSFQCEGGEEVQISHRVTERTTLGPVVLRNDEERALFAPLGTLWGNPPFHEGRRIGGSGAGEIATALIGSHFQPSAADWSGAEVRYRLLVGDSIDAGTLDLFAHPPLVRPGAYVAP